MNLKKKSFDHSIDRRRFIRQASCSSLGITGLVSSLSQLQMMGAEMGGSNPGDYKALVVLFLRGGNDSTNMLFPTEGSEHAAYVRRRGGLNGLALNVTEEMKLAKLSPADPEYAVHPMLTGAEGLGEASLGAQDIPGLYQNGDLAFVANVGTLVKPISNYNEYLTELGIGSQLPPRLFSHSDQALQWQSSIPNQPFTSGWGGRAADLLNPLFNGGANDSGVSMSISAGGINRFQFGGSREVAQYAVSSDGTFSLDAVRGGRNVDAFNRITNYAYENVFEKSYGEIVANAQGSSDTIQSILDLSNDTNSDVSKVNAAFDGYANVVDGDLKKHLNRNGGLVGQLRMVARLIAGRSCLSSPRRQIFFCAVDGFDTHQGQKVGHSLLMGELKIGLSRFNAAMKQIDQNDEVMLMTNSDFGRTVNPNNSDVVAASQNDATIGTDHAWGGHQIVMGGAVDGGKIFGSYPTLDDSIVLTASNRLDVDTRGRGRYIPTTSVDQYSSIAARWMGLSDANLASVFPNLGEFGDTSTEVGGVAGRSFDFLKSTSA